jgi:hypothetical protein
VTYPPRKVGTYRFPYSLQGLFHPPYLPLTENIKAGVTNAFQVTLELRNLNWLIFEIFNFFFSQLDCLVRDFYFLLFHLFILKLKRSFNSFCVPVLSDYSTWIPRTAASTTDHH